MVHAHLFGVSNSVYRDVRVDPIMMLYHTKQGVFKELWLDLLANKVYERLPNEVKWMSWRQIMASGMSPQTDWYMRRFLEIFKRELVDDDSAVKTRTPYPRIFKKSPNRTLMDKSPPDSLNLLLKRPTHAWMNFFLEFLAFVSKQRFPTDGENQVMMAISAHQLQTITNVANQVSQYCVSLQQNVKDLEIQNADVGYKYTVANYEPITLPEVQQYLDDIPFDNNSLLRVEMFTNLTQYSTGEFKLGELLPDEDVRIGDGVKSNLQKMASKIVQNKYMFSRLMDHLNNALEFARSNSAMSNFAERVKASIDKVRQYKKNLYKEPNSLPSFEARYTQWQVAQTCLFLKMKLNDKTDPTRIGISALKPITLVNYYTNSTEFYKENPYKEYGETLQGYVDELCDQTNQFGNRLLSDLRDMIDRAEQDVRTQRANRIKSQFTGDTYKQLMFDQLGNDIDMSIATNILEVIPGEAKPTGSVNAEYLARRVVQEFEHEIKLKVDAM